MVLQGRTNEAEGYFKRALQEAKKGFGEADAHVAAACNNLAEFYRVTRQPEKAEPLYLEVSLRRILLFFNCCMFSLSACSVKVCNMADAMTLGRVLTVA